MKYMSKFGYKIDKQDLNPAQVQKIKMDLNIKPISSSDFPNQPAFNVFVETRSQYILPTWYGLQEFGKPDKSYLAMNVPAPNMCKFDGELRPNQIEPMKVCLEYLKTHQRGVLCLPTGTGKTFCSLYLASTLGQKTLVIVNKRTLMDQWKEEIKRFIHQARIGTLHQDQSQTSEDFDVTIAMWQTLNVRNQVPGDYGLIIMDECHRVSSKIFNTVLFKINAPYVIGLSATPERKDGLECVMHFHIGNVMYRERQIKRGKLPTEIVIAKYSGNYATSPRQFSTFITELVNDQERTEHIAAVISAIFDRDDGKDRHVLVLTDRVGHAEQLRKTIDDALKDSKTSKTVAIFTGKQSLKDFESAKRASVIVATYKIFEEGISVESLNTLVLATPKRTITQAIGRIYRKEHQVPPMIVDIADVQLKGQLRCRMETYKTETNGNCTFAEFT